MKSRWDHFYQDLRELRSHPIPRKCIPSLSLEFKIHRFFDVFEEAFGAAMCIRSKNEMGCWASKLLCSKTPVAPLNGSIIPRLELSGALILAQLAKKTAEDWELEEKDIYLWTDSMIVLRWLNNQSCRLKTYVANHVNQILEITETQQWKYVKTDENPIDKLSRGITPKELHNKELWWNRPHWIAEELILWSNTPIFIEEEDILKQC